MRTEKQKQASRENGEKSRGPKTPEGKKISRNNALRHGHLANTILIDVEDPAAFDNMYEAYLDQFRPNGPVQVAYVEEMAASYWRIRRLWAAESDMVNQALAAARRPLLRRRLRLRPTRHQTRVRTPPPLRNPPPSHVPAGLLRYHQILENGISKRTRARSISFRSCTFPARSRRPISRPRPPRARAAARPPAARTPPRRLLPAPRVCALFLPARRARRAPAAPLRQPPRRTRPLPLRPRHR